MAAIDKWGLYPACRVSPDELKGFEKVVCAGKITVGISSYLEVLDKFKTMTPQAKDELKVVKSLCADHAIAVPQCVVNLIPGKP